MDLSGISTGIEVIDAGHHALTRRLAELEWAIASRCSKEIVGLFIADFGELAIRHFEQEEEVLSSIGYPGLERHQQEHRMLISELECYAGAFARDGITSAHAVLAFLERWTVNHLSNADADYLPYVKAARDLNR